MPTYPTLSAKEYVNRSGCQCPVCKESAEVVTFTYSDLRVDGPDVFQDVECNHCKSTWADHFVLTGYHLNTVGPAMATVSELRDQYRDDPVGHPEHLKSTWRGAIHSGYEDGYAQWLWERLQ